jgi:hypothetical protein
MFGANSEIMQLHIGSKEANLWNFFSRTFPNLTVKVLLSKKLLSSRQTWMADDNNLYIWELKMLHCYLQSHHPEHGIWLQGLAWLILWMGDCLGIVGFIGFNVTLLVFLMTL